MSCRFEGPRRNRELLRRCRAIYRRRTPPPASAAWMAARGEAAMRLVSATATLYNTPSLSPLSLSLSVARGPRQLVSKKEAACLASFLLEARLLSRPLEPASTRHSAVRSERSAFTIHKKAPRRRRGDGPEEEERERADGAALQPSKLVSKQKPVTAVAAAVERAGRMVAGVTTPQRGTPRPNAEAAWSRAGKKRC